MIVPHLFLADRRSQLLVANSKVVSPVSNLSDALDNPDNEDLDDLESQGTSVLLPRRGSVNELDIDDPELDYSIGRAVMRTPQVLVARPSTHLVHDAVPPPETHERSPLLQETPRFSYAPRSSHSHIVEGGSLVVPTSIETSPDQPDHLSTADDHLTRRNSFNSFKNSNTKHNYGGASTYGQTVGC